jgi:hypothetical protein
MQPVIDKKHKPRKAAVNNACEDTVLLAPQLT